MDVLNFFMPEMRRYLIQTHSTGAGPLKKNPPRKITPPPHQVFGDLGSKWPPDEDPGCCRAGTPWHFALFAQIQYGHRSPGLVTPTFFLWEKNQKFFFLPWGFHILAGRKNIFRHPGSSNRALRCFWLILVLKRANFDQFQLKSTVFGFLKICLY